MAKDLSDFLREHGVKDSVSADGVLGCPHEEGVDYPDDEVCPQCPFWANRDRYSGVIDRAANAERLRRGQYRN